MRIEIRSEAENDLVAGAKFYKRRCVGLGEYFLDSLYSDIDPLLLYAGKRFFAGRVLGPRATADGAKRLSITNE
jgi:hypothetical protein